MTRKKWPLILLFLGAFVAIAAGVGITMWNKPHKKVEDTKGVPVTASELIQKFSADENAANTAYLGKALEVTGIVSETAKDQDGNVVVTLQGDDPFMSIKCTMRDKTAALDSGKSVTIKGFCSGNTMFDVLLTDCVVQ